MKHKRLKDARGFIILVVLAAAAVVAAVVAAQFITSQQAQLSGIRASEEVRARAIAEACLSMVGAAVNGYPLPGNNDDYDLILDPDSTPNSADDFIPFGLRPVQIPSGATGTLHQWELITIGDGVCAVRFDDNSDDGRSLLPGLTEDPGEGPSGNPNPNRDRDRSIYLTAIGIYPMLPSTTDATAYDNAHARVTLRSVLSRSNVYAPYAPGAWAGNDTNVASNVDICGLGGISSGGTATLASNTCTCGAVSGAVSGELPVSGETCAGCPTPPPPASACLPSSSSATPPPPPPVWVHWGAMGVGGHRDREGWSAPPEIPLINVNDPPPPSIGYNQSLAPNDTGSIVGNVPAPAPFCAFYAEGLQGWLYVWDAGDAATGTTLKALTGGAFLVDTNADNIGDADLPDEDCTNAGTRHLDDPIRRPCSWPYGGQPQIIDCQAGETACWKPQAIMAGVPNWEIGIGDNPVLCALPGAACDAYEATDNWFPEEWNPRKNVALPNVALGKTFGTGANRLCGDAANNCTNCNTTSHATPGVATNSDLAIRGAATEWHIHGANNEEMPSPSVWIFEGDLKVHGSFGSGSGPWRTTLLSSNGITFTNSGEMCCATCDCTTANSINASTCGMNNLFGQLDANVQTITQPLSAPPSPPGDTVFVGAGGILIKSRSNLLLQGSSTYVGDIRAGSVNIPGSTCIVGNVIGYGPTAGGSQCSGNCGGSYVCGSSSLAINGDVHAVGSIDMASNTSIYGNMLAQGLAPLGSICLASNTNVDGLLIASTDINLASNIRLVNDDDSDPGASQNANGSITTYMEASW